MKDLERIKDRESESMYDMLAGYAESDFYPYHMPGHKRRRDLGEMSDFFRFDITEIDGFDNLHQAKGIIKRAQERAAGLYGSDESFFLVNGSTCGVLAAVLSAADKADTILAARNCHKSVYHAAFLQELNLRYIYPEYIEEYDIHGAVNPETVKSALEQCPECKAVVITSPTYEGVISDVAAIAEIVHRMGKPLIVDEAHGAHLGLAEGMPENAVRQGADLVIHSLHKTLPSMTQTALLHVNGSYVNRAKLRRYLSIFQSSSPSYVFMAGMDACISYVRENASSDFAKLKICRRNFIRQTAKCRHIRVAMPELLDGGKYCFAAWDVCKLVISVKGTSISGKTLYDILRDEFHLQMEMAAGSFALAIMTIADSEEAWKRLADALIQIDGRIEGVDDIIMPPPINYKPIVKMGIAQALQAAYAGNDDAPCMETQAVCKDAVCFGMDAADNKKEVRLEQALGKISGDFVNLYPPGIPILVPGEAIDETVIRQIQYSMELGLDVQGISSGGTILVL